MQKTPKQRAADYHRNWPYSTPHIERAPFSTKCAASKQRIESGERCAVYRGNWYKLDTDQGRQLAIESEKAPLDYFA